MTAASEVLAVNTVALVFEFTAPVIPDVALLVFALTSATTELDAFVTSDCTASDPVSRPAPVSVLTLLVHTSAAKVPNDERVRDVYDQIALGSVAKSEDDAVAIALLVLALTADVIPEV